MCPHKDDTKGSSARSTVTAYGRRLPRRRAVRLLGLVLLAAGVGQGLARAAPAPHATDTPPKAVSIVVEPARAAVARGGRARIAVRIDRGSPGRPVKLALRGAPRGVKAVFRPNPASGGESVLSITVGSQVRLGSHRLSITGAAGTDRPAAALGLRVAKPAPLSSVRIEGSVRPRTVSVPPLGGGPTRPVARLVDARGRGVDFVADELVVATRRPKLLAAFVHRWRGQVLKALDPADYGLVGPKPIYLVRVQTDQADESRLPQDLRAIDPGIGGDLRLSSRAARRLLAAAAHEAAGGLAVSLNFLSTPSTFLDKSSIESPNGPFGGYDSNAFAWSYMKVDGAQSIGVVEAWRKLEFAGRANVGSLTENPIKLAIIEDRGFAPNADFPAGWSAVSLDEGVPATGAANPGCPPSTGCSWHGTSVALAAAGVADNGFGAAGPGGPVADLDLITMDDSDGVLGWFEALAVAKARGARIVNMSWGADVPALGTLGLIQLFEDWTLAARNAGVLIFAGAGNDGQDVDADDCPVAGACWEETWWAPCENAGVICVGGLGPGSRAKFTDSNYGLEDVDIYAPWRVLVGPDPRLGTPIPNTAQWFTGTSAASPFAAGVAALIWAGNPALTADDVEWAMMYYAYDGDDHFVERYVQARVPVDLVVGNTPPRIEIASPTNGAHLGYGGLNTVQLKATLDDYEKGCCTVTWVSDKDGTLGTGTLLEHLFPSAGPRVVTAIAKDVDGGSASAKILLFVDNAAPTVKILKPVEGATFYRNEQTKLLGTSSDSNEGTLTLPCSALSWSVGQRVVGGAALTYAGCQPLATFPGTGEWLVTLSATDSDGAKATDSVTVTVVDPPPHSPPSVTITQPDENAVLDPHVKAKLSGTATDPDGSGRITYKWTVTVGNNETQIGNTATMLWTPSDNVKGCGVKPATLRLYAGDADGTKSDSVKVYVPYPVC